MSVCFFADELFAFAYTFMNEHSNPKKNKHEENTKKRRRKHERNTQFCVFFVWRRRKSTGKNSPLIGVKNQWSKLDHWKAKGQNDTLKSKAQKEPLVWLKTNQTTSCQDGARLQTLSQVATRWHSKMPPRNFFGKPIDKIRSVWYTLIKEVEVLL